MPARRHELSHVNAYEAGPGPPKPLLRDTPKRFVAWCTCGLGTRRHETVSEAIDGLEVHLQDPERLPDAEPAN